MCEFLSWKRSPWVRGNYSKILFLTDNEVFSPHGRQTLIGTKDNDVFGHGAIDAFYGEAAKGFVECENRNFWRRSEFPPEIAKHLESPQTLLATWGKMLRQYLQPDDAYYILCLAPEPWRSALMDLCVGHIAEEAYYSHRALCNVSDLTEEQRDIFVEGAAKDPSYAFYALRDVRSHLTDKQKDVLIRGVVKSPTYAHFTLCEGYLYLTEEQVELLKESKESSL